MAVIYNVAVDLIERNLRAGRGDKAAFIDRHGTLSYGALACEVRRFAGALLAAGVRPTERLILCLPDDRRFPAAFLGAIWAGVVPVPVNPMLSESEYRYLAADSGAVAAIVDVGVLDIWRSIAATLPGLRILSDTTDADLSSSDSVTTDQPPALTCASDIAFWLYSSGSTGNPKGVLHRHSSISMAASLYGEGVAGLGEIDVVLSVAKLFFAYGLGNSLSFPLWCGATSVLLHGRSTPEAVAALIDTHGVTVLCGVPSFFVRWLAAHAAMHAPHPRLRLGISAGEPLPAALATALAARLGVDVIDGLGSTELLHIFVAQRPGSVRPDVIGRAVRGYELRVVDRRGIPLPAGAAGQLQVRGPTAAAEYWRQPAKTRATFTRGGWINTGDLVRLDADGWCKFIGRADDMIKVSGRFLSPVEVEAALLTHPAVVEAAVVAATAHDGLGVAHAHVVLAAGVASAPALASDLDRHVRAQLPRFKCPAAFHLVDHLPRTATGKLQRYRLRDVC